MPELPIETRKRLLAKGLTPRDVDFLLNIDSERVLSYDGIVEDGMVQYLDEVSRGCDVKTAFNW